MGKALIVIDYTYDFVADDGRLTCGKPGQAIDGYITSLTRQFVENGDYVVFAVDVHDEADLFHPETKLFPPHNLRGTNGRDLYGQLGLYYRELTDGVGAQSVGSDAACGMGLPANVKWMDKTRYSSFAGTDLEIFLNARGVNELHLVGVCTDICVLHTAVDAYNKGYSIVIHEQGVASFNPAGHDWALGHFKGSLGAAVVS